MYHIYSYFSRHEVKSDINIIVLVWNVLTMCRADTVYRLCYSSLIIHWRSYMMFTRDSLFKPLFSFDEVTTGHWRVVTMQLSPAQECVVMCQTLSMLLAGSRIYEAASVLIRWGGHTPYSHLNKQSVQVQYLLHPGIGLWKVVWGLRSWKPSKETSLSTKFSSSLR